MYNDTDLKPLSFSGNQQFHKADLNGHIQGNLNMAPTVLFHFNSNIFFEKEHTTLTCTLGRRWLDCFLQA